MNFALCKRALSPARHVLDNTSHQIRPKIDPGDDSLLMGSINLDYTKIDGGNTSLLMWRKNLVKLDGRLRRKFEKILECTRRAERGTAQALPTTPKPHFSFEKPCAWLA